MTDDGETLDAGLELLDKQVVDAAGVLLGKVDDLRFDVPRHGGPPELAALLIGQRALGRRLGGRFGAWWTAVAARLSGGAEPAEVPVERIADIGPAVRLDALAAEFPELLAAERALRRAFIGRIPGAGDASG